MLALDVLSRMSILVMLTDLVDAGIIINLLYTPIHIVYGDVVIYPHFQV